MFNMFACCREIIDGKKLIQLIELESKYKKVQLKAEEEISQVKARGTKDVPQMVKLKNFTFLFGCQPGSGVLADTKSAKDFINLMLNYSSLENDTIMLP